MRTYKKSNNKTNLTNYIIITLTVIILLITINITIKYKQHTKDKSLFNSQKTRMLQQLTNTKVENWQQKEEILKDTLQKQNELIVLEGQRDIRKVFSVTDHELQYQGKDNMLRWMVDKLNKMQTRLITVETRFNYMFAYTLQDIDLHITDGTVYISLHRSKVQLKPIAEDSNKRIITDDRGVLSKKFTTQEVSSVMHVTQVSTYNNLINDNELYNKALHSVGENLKELCDKLGYKYVDIEIVESVGTLENNEVVVLGDRN